MAFTHKNLAFIQLPSVKGDVYTVPAATKAFVHLITLCNTNTTNEVVTLYYYPNGGSEIAFLNSFTITPNDTVFFEFGNTGFTMEASSKITGITTTASKVTIKVDGTEQA